MSDNTEELIGVALNNYRQGKELFSINVYGCSLGDILLTILIVPFLFGIYHEICDLLFKGRWYGNVSKASLFTIHFILETIIFVVPVLGVCTVYHERTILYLTLCIIWIILHSANMLYLLFGRVIISVSFSDETKKHSSILLTEGTVESDRKGYITAFRSIVVLYTCLAILAVDFTVFPRKYAKTYLTGYSLMDIGVGLYIVTSGLVGGIKHPSVQSFFQRELSLILLGFGRFYFVKWSGYVVNQLEYGTHWNFFFTLALVLAGGYVIVFFASSRFILLGVAVGIMIYYQGMLSMGLSDYIRENPGNDWFDLNVAGMFSTIGFLCLYLAAAYIGRLLNDRKVSRLFVRLLLLTVGSGCGFYLLNTYVQPASRRMCNAAFILLVFFITLVIISVSYAVNVFYGSAHIPIILHSINNHQLVVFLLANVMTGAVNMCIKTMLVESAVSLLILFCYMMILCLCACLIDLRKKY